MSEKETFHRSRLNRVLQLGKPGQDFGACRGSASQFSTSRQWGRRRSASIKRTRSSMPATQSRYRNSYGLAFPRHRASETTVWGGFQDATASNWFESRDTLHPRPQTGGRGRVSVLVAVRDGTFIRVRPRGESPDSVGILAVRACAEFGKLDKRPSSQRALPRARKPDNTRQVWHSKISLNLVGAFQAVIRSAEHEGQSIPIIRIRNPLSTRLSSF